MRSALLHLQDKHPDNCYHPTLQIHLWLGEMRSHQVYGIPKPSPLDSNGWTWEPDSSTSHTAIASADLVSMPLTFFSPQFHSAALYTVADQCFPMPLGQHAYLRHLLIFIL